MSNVYYLGVVMTAFMSAVSQILLNVSARKKYDSKIREYLNVYVIASYFILFVTLAINVYLLRFMGLQEENAVAASTYVFVLILSRVILKEKITLKKVIGNVLIVVGILVFIM